MDINFKSLFKKCTFDNQLFLTIEKEQINVKKSVKEDSFAPVTINLLGEDDLNILK